MENYEQHNEVSTSYNNNNLKHNFNECKNDFYQFVDVNYLEKEKQLENKDYIYDQKNFRVKLEEGQISHSLTTPFSVKDILNINQPNYSYDRNEAWKYNERVRPGYEYDQVYQGHVYPPENLQVYPNVPVPANIEPYWNQDVYHDHKINDYYGYNPYCHNLYHQNYEQYSSEVVPGPHVAEEASLRVENEERESLPTNSLSVQKRVSIEKSCTQFPPEEKTSGLCRKINSKFQCILLSNFKLNYTHVLRVINTRR